MAFLQASGFHPSQMTKPQAERLAPMQSEFELKSFQHSWQNIWCFKKLFLFLFDVAVSDLQVEC